MNGIEMLASIRKKLVHNFDIKYREIQCIKGNITLVFADSLCDAKFISEYIVTPLLEAKLMKNNTEEVKKEILMAGIVGDINTEEEALINILSGNVVIIFSFYSNVLYCEAKGFSKRSITTPITETNIKGPREGFNEPFIDNVSLLRRRIRDVNLKFENLLIGGSTKTTIVLVYLQNKVHKELLNYVKEQVNNIKSSETILTNHVEEQFQCKYTLFDTVGYSEKPEKVASKICEGRIAIIVDGSPFVITVPYFFIENFEVTDDYTSNKYFASGIRIFRWFAFIMASLLTGFYVAIVTHHFSLIPYSFIFRLAIARAGVPFPTVIEVLVMMIFFQLSREAGIRLPQPIGLSMSIVGSLILGDATVGANIASQTTLIIVAIASISSFLIPNLYGVAFFWSIIIIFFSTILGLPGFYIGFCILVSHMAGLNSCGYPFLFPLGTLKQYKYKDLLLRGDLNRISNNILDEDKTK
ncbi:spore germination protein [Candidatus Clostridium stratigraminis]|uniref:Spore germination protein n=1 Tax=Candidatus Clostridium stratigraminis TaxID=3381661 RepID=A0ABW8T1T9_9CLOT